MGYGFLKLEGLKLPDFADFLSDLISEECEERCLRNCSCLAYSYSSGIGCMVWYGRILDVQEFSISGQELFLRLAEAELGNSSTPHNLLAQILGNFRTQSKDPRFLLNFFFSAA